MGYRKLPRRLHRDTRSGSEIAADVDEEIAFHLEMRAAALVAGGLSAAAAAEQARREFGDAVALRRLLREADAGVQRRVRLVQWLDDLWQDTRFAVRSAVRNPLFSVVSAATLVLGIGASVAIFTVVNAVLLRPLPYPDPDRLVQLSPGRNFNITLSREVAAGASSLESATGIAHWGLTLTGVGDAAELTGQAVAADFFRVFGVAPALGRPFGEAEQEPSAADVVILSHDLWTTRFGGDAAVLGQRFDFDGGGHRSREVIGVMPRNFTAPVAAHPSEMAFWIPLSLAAGRTFETDSTWYVNHVIGRMHAGADVAGVAAEVRAAVARIRAESGGRLSEEDVQLAGALRLRDSMTGDARTTLLMLQGAVGLVLLLACANVANLLLARGDRRRQELAARAALGGTRGRLVRELVTESAVLALFGATGGLLLAQLLLRLLGVAEASGLPRAAELGIDLRVVGFTIAVTILALLTFAVLPALRATAGDLRPDLGAGGRVPGRARAGRRFGATLIAGEVALALMLVTAAGLLLTSMRTLRAVDPGLRAADVLAVTVTPPPAEYHDERAILLYDRLLDRLRGLPGVRAAGAIHLLPFTPNNWGFPYLAEGHAPPAGAPLPSANFRVVTPGYFESVGVPILAGRDFNDFDRADGVAVGIVNRTMAERLWPGEDAIGREILLFGNVPFRVVGVVGDVHQHALDTQPAPEMYRPLRQWTLSSMVVMVQVAGDPRQLAGPVHAAVRELDGNVPVRSRPLAEVLGESMTQRRFLARTLSFFGLLALVLGGVGVYGVMSYAVAARTAEFGVRMALGATKRDVLRIALGSGMAPVLVGLLVGVAGALATTRVLESLLFGVRADDRGTLLLSAAVLALVALLASWWPARRATRIEPIRVLR